MDYEGRILTADFGDYYFVTVYTPNAGGELFLSDLSAG